MKKLLLLTLLLSITLNATTLIYKNKTNTKMNMAEELIKTHEIVIFLEDMTFNTDEYIKTIDKKEMRNINPGSKVYDFVSKYMSDKKEISGEKLMSIFNIYYDVGYRIKESRKNKRDYLYIEDSGHTIKAIYKKKAKKKSKIDLLFTRDKNGDILIKN